MSKNDKKPKPRARTTGHTWWGQRWIQALEHGSRDVVARLGKGRVYARDGHVQDLKIAAGKVIALVKDDDLEDYQVSLQLEVFTPETWQRILHTMSEQALFVGQLLNGEMPKQIGHVFHVCGKNLFPTSLHDIDADCSCEDWSSPCKHVAATHYVLGEVLDRDPFLLFELRGRSKEQVLSGLSHLRSGESGAKPISGNLIKVTSNDVVCLNELSADRFEEKSSELNLVGFDFDVLAISGSLLRSLGKPASWNISESPEELLTPLIVQARDLALEMATHVNPESMQQGWILSGGRARKNKIRGNQDSTSLTDQSSEHDLGE